MNTLVKSLLVAASVSGQDSDFTNPYLAGSEWPIAHMNSWNTDSSPKKGPQSAKADAQRLFNLFEFWKYLDPITILMTSDNKYFWASSLTGIFKVRVDGDKMTQVGYMWRDINMQFHGAYAFISNEDIYYTAGNDYISGYANKDKSDPESPIVEVKRHNIEGLLPKEHLVGLSATWDGNVVYITNYGKVGVLSMDFKFISNVVQLPGASELSLPGKMVTNSFALDSKGGVFVVGSMFMNKVRWNGDLKTLVLEWSTQYHDKEPEMYWGRFGPGSGASPTLMGHKGDGEAEYVVITDGDKQMNIIYFDSEKGQIMGQAPVTFGGMKSSQSEQSVVVKGYKAVVVNNWFEDSEVHTVCKFLKPFINYFGLADKIAQGCPFLLGQYAYGAEQFEIDPKTQKVSSVWHRDDMSCTSSIPVVTEQDNTFYCIGKSGWDFQLESLSWDTGVSNWSKPLGVWHNPFYAGNEIGDTNDFIIGTILGPVRVNQSINSSLYEEL